MNDAQREFLERVANSDHLIALGKVGSGSVAAALADLDSRDRRIAELEASLKRVCTEFQKVLDENDRAGIGPSADVNAEFGGEHPALDAALAAAKREALEKAADCFRDTVAWELRRMAREVKP